MTSLFMEPQTSLEQQQQQQNTKFVQLDPLQVRLTGSLPTLVSSHGLCASTVRRTHCS
jgi:hypothetical protein